MGRRDPTSCRRPPAWLPTTDRRRGRFPRLVFALLGAFCLLTGLIVSEISLAQETAGEGAPVYVVPITGTIDLGLAPYLERVLDEAADEGAAAVLLEIDTPGGRLDAVLQMQDALLGADVRTIAFVNRTAFSAGALVAIASEEIYMAPGAVMGAATPVEGGTGDTASEKVISAVRSTFRATAEARGRDPRVAEAMVDPAVAIDGLVEEGKLLTLTTTEAQQWGYAEGVVASRAELLDTVGLAGAPVIETEPSFAEDVARFVTDPIIASLLMTIGLLLIVGDFLVEGVGIPALVGGGLIALFFWGHLLAGLAGWEDLALIVLGLALIAVELFVIPGFGVPGVLGVAALLGGMFLAMLGREIQTPEGIERAGLSVAASLGLFVLGMIAIVALIPRSTRFGGLVLQANVGDAAAPAPATVGKPGGWLRLFGSGGTSPLERDRPAAVDAGVSPVLVARAHAKRTGVTLSDLRPSGIAEIDGQRVDVVSDGEYIRAGEPITIVRDDGYRRVVRRVAGSEKRVAS